MKPLTTLPLVLSVALAACRPTPFHEQPAPVLPRSAMPAVSGVSITDLGTLPGGGFSRALAVNAHGDIVGRAKAASKAFHAVLWRNEAISDLSEGYPSGANDINDRGQIVGWFHKDIAQARAALWENARLTELAIPPGLAQSEARSINESGQIVGNGTTPDGHRHALLWQDGRVLDLGMLPDAVESEATRIDDQGRITGYSTEASGGVTHAVLWQDGALVDLGALSGYYTDGAVLFEIGDGGRSPWSVVRSKGAGRSLIWRKGVSDDHPLLPGHTRGVAYAINAMDQVVGNSWSEGEGGGEACLWQKGSVIALGTPPGGISGIAFDINEDGVIVGDAMFALSEAERARRPRGSDHDRLVNHAAVWRIGR